MKFQVITKFPDMFAPVTTSILGNASKEGLIEISFVDLLNYGKGNYNKIDDEPYGGGPGMVMMADPIFQAMHHAGAKEKRVIYMSPRGRVLDQELISELAQEPELVILCGHYEGVDQRVLDYWEAEEISIGDYVLTGGELPAMVLMDSVARFIPGVLSSEAGAKEESIYSGLLEFPQYTRPASYEGMEVPEILRSGNHKKIDLWRFEESLRLTKERRPDLFDEFVKNSSGLSKDEQKVMEKVRGLL